MSPGGLPGGRRESPDPSDEDVLSPSNPAVADDQGWLRVGQVGNRRAFRDIRLHKFDPACDEIANLFPSRCLRPAGDRVDLWCIVRRWPIEAITKPQWRVYHALVGATSAGEAPTVQPALDDAAHLKQRDRLEPLDGTDLPPWLKQNVSCAPTQDLFDSRASAIGVPDPSGATLPCAWSPGIVCKVVEGKGLQLEFKGHTVTLPLDPTVRVRSVALAPIEAGGNVCRIDVVAALALGKIESFEIAIDEAGCPHIRERWSQQIAEHVRAIAFVAGEHGTDGGKLMLAFRSGRVGLFHRIRSDRLQDAWDEGWKRLWQVLGLHEPRAQIRWAMQVLGEAQTTATRMGELSAESGQPSLTKPDVRQALLLHLVQGVVDHGTALEPAEQERWMSACSDLFWSDDVGEIISPAGELLLDRLQRWAKTVSEHAPAGTTATLAPMLLARVYPNAPISIRERIDLAVKRILLLPLDARLLNDDPRTLSTYSFLQLAARSDTNRADLSLRAQEEDEEGRRGVPVDRVALALERWTSWFQLSDEIPLEQGTEGLYCQLTCAIMGEKRWLIVSQGPRLLRMPIRDDGRLDTPSWQEIPLGNGAQPSASIAPITAAGCLFLACSDEMLRRFDSVSADGGLREVRIELPGSQGRLMAMACVEAHDAKSCIVALATTKGRRSRLTLLRVDAEGAAQTVWSDDTVVASPLSKTDPFLLTKTDPPSRSGSVTVDVRGLKKFLYERCPSVYFCRVASCAWSVLQGRPKWGAWSGLSSGTRRVLRRKPRVSGGCEQSDLYEGFSSIYFGGATYYTSNGRGAFRQAERCDCVAAGPCADVAYRLSGGALTWPVVVLRDRQSELRRWGR